MRTVDELATIAETRRRNVKGLALPGYRGETLMTPGRKARRQRSGKHIAKICLGGLGEVRSRQIAPPRAGPGNRRPFLAASDRVPVESVCGLEPRARDREGSIFRAGSGPARALARKEPLFDELGYRDEGDVGRRWSWKAAARRRRRLSPESPRIAGFHRRRWPWSTLPRKAWLGLRRWTRGCWKWRCIRPMS